MLAESLGPGTLLLREPGGTEAGERVRELLKDPSLELDPRAELLLFCAARAELVERVIRPALAEGVDVVCDRFADSTVAYQGAGRGLGTDRVEAANAIALDGCLPDLTVLLRIDPAGAAGRGQQRLAAGEPDGADRFEGEGIELQRRVAAAYDEIAARDPGRVVVVDAERPLGEVHADVTRAVAERAEAAPASR
jgi:dTMP kinase